MKAVSFVYVTLLIYSAYRDYKTLKVDDWIHITVIILSAIYGQLVWKNIISACIITVLFLWIAVKTDGIGGGDIKFIGANACMLGLKKTYAGLIIGFGMLSFQYLIKKVFKVKGNSNHVIPLLPYLVTGFLIVFLI